ncbi:LOW QUALITY PROTEIN: hypothetical protein MXB_1980 [Myxobolus squamalis]|nr:LOW QUALITY PROTEIN: hypothetical protein MXB_1980 [Myxobolus squamalis]
MSSVTADKSEFFLPNLVISVDNTESLVKYHLKCNSEEIETRKKWPGVKDTRNVRAVDFNFEIEDSKEEKLINAARSLFEDKKKTTADSVSAGSRGQFVPGVRSAITPGGQKTAHNWFESVNSSPSAAKFGAQKQEFRIKISNLPHETNEKDISDLVDKALKLFKTPQSTFGRGPLFKTYLEADTTTNI